MSHFVISAYTIGTRQDECYGHGDNRETLSIRQRDDKFPPIYFTKEEAEHHLSTIKYPIGMQVVEVKIHTKVKDYA